MKQEERTNELIERLREYAEWARANEWEVPLCLADDLEAAADKLTADVAPVRHSYWETYITPQFMGLDDFNEPKLRDGRLFICHERQCRYKTVIRSNYCPKCGAKMDGGVDK